VCFVLCEFTLLGRIVEMHGTFMDTARGLIPGKKCSSVHPVIVMDYLGGGDMFDRIQYQATVSERDLANTFRQIVVALDNLHQRRFVHRDLKLENVMLEDKSADPVIKLIDFGMMVQLPPDSDTFTSPTVLGTAGYVGEIFRRLRLYIVPCLVSMCWHSYVANGLFILSVSWHVHEQLRRAYYSSSTPARATCGRRAVVCTVC
jgi:serine/threonine protein kinase